MKLTGQALYDYYNRYLPIKHKFNVSWTGDQAEHYDYQETGELFDSRDQAEQWVLANQKELEISGYSIRTIEEDYGFLYEDVA